MKNNSPLTKFWIMLFFFSGIIQPAFVKIILLALLLLLSLYCKIFKKIISYLITRTGGLIFFMILLQGIFYPGTTTIWKYFSIEGLIFAFNMGSSILLMAGSISWFFTTTTVKDFVYALEKKGVNHQITYIILNTLQMIPLLKQNSQTIIETQQCRGIEFHGSAFNKIRSFFYLVAPLFLSTFIGLEDRVQTLKARGFPLEGRRSRIHPIPSHGNDHIIALSGKILCILNILLRIGLWTV